MSDAPRPTETHRLLMDVEAKLDEAWGLACGAADAVRNSAEASAAEDVRCQTERLLRFVNGACADLIGQP